MCKKIFLLIFLIAYGSLQGMKRDISSLEKCSDASLERASDNEICLSRDLVGSLPNFFSTVDGFSDLQQDAFDSIAHLTLKNFPIQRMENIAISRDASCCAVCVNKTIHIFDTKTQALTQKINYNGIACRIALSNNGKILAIAYSDHLNPAEIKIFSVDDGKQYASLFCHRLCYIHTIDFSPDGSYLVSGCSQNLQVHDLKNRRSFPRYELHHSELVGLVAFNHDGTWLATTCYDNTVRIFAMKDGQMIASILHPERVNSVAFSRDGMKFATGCNDGYARVFSGNDSHELFAMGHGSYVGNVSFNFDDSCLLTDSADGNIRIFDLKKKRCKYIISHPENSELSAFIDEGEIIVYAYLSDMLRVFDLKKNQHIMSSLTLDEYELLNALMFAQSETKGFKAEREKQCAYDFEGMNRYECQELLMELYPHKTARIHANKKHWQTWLTLGSKFPASVQNRLSKYIVKDDASFPTTQEPEKETDY